MLKFTLKAIAASEVLIHLRNLLEQLAAEIPETAAAAEKTR
jgi:hypothetical protein